MKLAIVLVAFVVFAAPALAKTFNRCSLAREMHDKYHVPKSELALWTCIAEHESSYRTDTVGKRNKDGSKDYGIFQINNKYWCKTENFKSSNKCHIDCKELVKNDINESIKCARQIQKEQGWSAWAVYKPKCSGLLPSIDQCFKVAEIINNGL